MRSELEEDSSKAATVTDGCTHRLASASACRYTVETQRGRQVARLVRSPPILRRHLRARLANHRVDPHAVSGWQLDC